MEYRIEVYLGGNWCPLIRHCFQSVAEAIEYCDRAMANFQARVKVLEIDGNNETIVYQKRYNPRTDPDFFGDYDDFEDSEVEEGISWKKAGF